MPRPGEAAPTLEELQKRRLLSMRLRKEGKSYYKIAEQTGVSANQAYEDVMYEVRKLSREMKEEAADVRALEVQRLDMVVERLDPLIDCEHPDMDAVEALLKVMNRRAKLLGLDAASKQEIVVDDARTEAKRLSNSEVWEKARRLRDALERKGIAAHHPIQDEKNPFLLEPAIEAVVIARDD